MFKMASQAPMYDQNAVQPMRDALIAVGFSELLSANDVEEAIDIEDNKTALVIVNSVCGCAAGSARPGISLALQNEIIPDKLFTGFAGQERDAVDKIRLQLDSFPPSSPSIALFKDGRVLHFMQRHQIEGRTGTEIANDWKEIFNQHCSNKGPSISAENFAEVNHAVACGSKIPLFNG
jgi:putative YphP/YqiW family bacilliredoxin